MKERLIAFRGRSLCLRGSCIRGWAVAVGVLAAGTASTARAENWPQWRGPHNNGTTSETGLPVEWSKTKNVAWRVELPGPAGATPVVWEDRIFLTSAKGQDLVLLCVDHGGDILWERTFGRGDQAVRGDEGNSASPSPITDGEFVWSAMSTGDLACYDLDGNEQWKFNLQDRYGKFEIPFGMTSTPVLDGDVLYFQCMHQTAAIVFALDKRTGEEVWKQDRPSDAHSECLDAYASPIIYRDQKLALLLTHGADYLVAHRLTDGKEVWRCGGFNPKGNYDATLRLVASPVAAEGMIVIPSAKNRSVIALTPDNAGDITDTEQGRLWTRKAETPDVPSPLIHDGLVYLCRENGELICMDAKTGEEQYLVRCHSDRYRASPVCAEGKLFLASRGGVVTVVKEGRTFEALAVNDMQEGISSSPVIAGGRIYLRTLDALYAIEDQP